MIERPSDLQRCQLFSGFSAWQLEHMVGAHCLHLKPYQLAALGLLSAFMQQSTRGCILAADSGLGTRTVMSVWLAVLGRSNTRPLCPTPSSPLPSDKHVLHMAGLIVAQPQRVAGWRTALQSWAPGSRVAVIIDGNSAGVLAAEIAAMARVGMQPYDIVLVSASLLMSGTAGALAELTSLPWLAAIIDQVASLQRDAFSALRPLLAQAQVRVAVETGALPCSTTDAPALRSLLELAQPQVFDARRGQRLSMVPCATSAAEAVRDQQPVIRACLGERCAVLSSTGAHHWCCGELHSAYARAHVAYEVALCI